MSDAFNNGIRGDYSSQNTVSGQAEPNSKHVGEIMDAFREHMRVNEELGLLSDSEMREQRSFVEHLSDPDDIAEAMRGYVSEEAGRSLGCNVEYYNDKFIAPLHAALEGNKKTSSRPVISKESYDEWIAWVHDRNRNSPEKKTSIDTVLPKYLKERWKIAEERAVLLDNKNLDNVKNPKLKKEIAYMKDDKEWFETLSFSERKNLLDRIKAGLAAEKGGDVYEKLFKSAEKVLISATQKPQPALHRDKVGTWLKRIFESGASPKQIDAFITGNGQIDGHSLPVLINIWRRVAIDFWVLRKDPAFAGVKTEFINTKAFLWKHYDDRVVYIQRMKTQRDRAKVLRAQAMTRVDVPDRADWIGKHLFNGSHTLADLESLINGDLAQHLSPIQDYMEGQEVEKEKDQVDSGEPEASQIDSIIKNLPVDLQSMLIMLCELGSGAVQACGWGIYNRAWCNKNGYLDEEREQAAIRNGKTQALMMDRDEKKGAMSETIQGKTGEKKYIKLSRSSATNVCLDIADTGAKSAFVETVRRTKNDGRAWYWTNVIFHRQGDLMGLGNQKSIQNKVYKIRNLMRSMEGRGEQYSFGGVTSVAKAVPKPKKASRSGAEYAGSKT